MAATSNHGWIGVDLDGTLAHYDGWKGETHIGTPIQAMVKRIRKWIARGQKVKIFTARMHNRPDMAGIVQNWLEKVAGLPKLEVTNVKDYGLVQLWDDRAVQVIPNTGEPVRKEDDV